MLSFNDLTLENWPLYREVVMRSEAVFPTAISFDEDSYLEALATPNVVAKLALLNGAYIGIALGCPLTAKELAEDEIEGVENSAAMYMYNLLIVPEYQGRGYGKELFFEFIEAARHRGYVLLLGHFRKNASLALIKRFGAQERKICPNWSDSGEEYVFCELNIMTLPSPVITRQAMPASMA